MSLIAVSYPKILKKDFDWIQSLRKKYDPDGYKLLDAHITFVFPTEKLKQTEFVNFIRPKIQGFPGIQFEMTHFKLSARPFDGKWFISLAPSKGKAEIIKLHDILYSGILKSKLRIEYSFDPHITVGCLEDKDSCLHIVEELNKINFCVDGCVENIDAATYINNQIETIEKISLKK